MAQSKNSGNSSSSGKSSGGSSSRSTGGQDKPRNAADQQVPADDKTSAQLAEEAEQAAGQVQEAVDAETERGYLGGKADPTPNEHYTVDGVTSGKPTPESDRALAEETGSGRFRGAAESK
jgi:hypothetical protein